MSFEQTPGTNPAPLPTEMPPAAGGSLPTGMAPPVFRQDEFVRRPTSWTRPMQLAVAAYFVISTIGNFVIQLAFAADIKSRAAAQIAKQLRTSGQPVTQASIDSALNLGLTIALVFGIIFGLLFIGLAILTASKPRAWVFWLDLVLMVLGALGLVSAIGGIANPSAASMPQGASAVSLLFGLADVALAVWMIMGLVRYGPWALEKAPATL